MSTRTRTSPGESSSLGALVLLLICGLVPPCRCTATSTGSGNNVISQRFRLPHNAAAAADDPRRRRRAQQDDLLGGAIQSGPDMLGPSYVSSAMYHVASETLHIVGTTFGDYFLPSDAAGDGTSSSCFYAVIGVDTTEHNSMAWAADRQQMGVPQVNEACQNMYMDERAGRLYITGQSQPDGLLASLASGGIGMENQVQLGMILDYSFDSEIPWSHLNLVGGHVLQDEAVVYPVALASEENNGDILYQVSMQSTDYARNDLSSTDETAGTPIDPVDHYLYGKTYYMRVEGFQAQTSSLDGSSPELQKTLKNYWTGVTMGTTDGHSVFVSGMVTTGRQVFVAGSSLGARPGDGFGVPMNGVTLSDRDFDGFVTKFSPNSGEIPDPSTGLPSGALAYRVAAGTGTNDWVHGICTSGNAGLETDAPNFIYIVGATGGLVATQISDETQAAALDAKVRAYVAKINTLTMTLEWAENFESTPAPGASEGTAVVRGISCASTDLGEAVFVAGVVEGGSVLMNSGTTASMGGTDVFVAKITRDGNVSFVRQMGSAHEDTLAKRGAVVTMPSGDAIVVGNTKGAIYRDRREDGDENPKLGAISDVFAFTINGNTGEFVFPLEHEKFAGLPIYNPTPDETPTPPMLSPTEPIPSPPTEPAPAPTDSVVVPAPAPPFPPPSPTLHAPASSADKAGNGSGVEKWVILLLLLIGAIMAIFLSIWYVNSHVMAQKEVGTDRSKVLEYLHGFDVEDVDLKHSATGGWHCSYANALAQGINSSSTSRGSSVNTSGDGLLGSDDDSDLILSFDPLTASSSKPLDTGNSLFGDSLSNQGSHIIEAEGITFGGARGSRPRLTRGASKRMASGSAGLGGSNTQYDGLMNSSSYDSDGLGGSSPPSNNATSRKKEQWGRDII